MAWSLAKCTSDKSYKIIRKRMNDIYSVKWLDDIGVEKWSLAHSNRHRYG